MAGDDTALFVLAEVLSLLNYDALSWLNYLLVPANATQLLGGLSDFMQHLIESEVAVRWRLRSVNDERFGIEHY